MKYILIRTGVIDAQMVSLGGMDDNMHCQELFHCHDTSCFEISDTLFNTLRPTWDSRIVELEYEVAHWGSVFFSEIRTVGKLTEPSPGPWTAPVKVPVEITETLIGYIVKFMKMVAIETINQEMNRRIFALGSNSEVERASWEIQKHEAREWLDKGAESYTPFLDYLTQEHGEDKTTYANSILVNAEKYADKLSDMLVVQQKLLKELKSYTTVWDLNIFYEKYLGVYMPDTQAMQIPGWTVSETDPTRTTEVKIHEFNF